MQISNGSGKYSWRYRADKILSTDGQMDRRTRWNQYTPPLSTSFKWGYKRYFWWLLRRVTDLQSTACKHYRKCDVTDRYLHIELIWCLLMVQYLQNTKTTLSWNGQLILLALRARFPWNMAPPQLHLLSLTVKNSDVKLRISHCDPKNLQYNMHPSFDFSHMKFSKWVSIIRHALY